ncbi:cytochrome P450 [Saccharopolyspora sp. NPDC000359]|uniref:cytochrome P450 n=1 Tax=Saccharopolyspora sp. NPDC000359 TaxID=3154251 RepID=UPI00331A6F82
MGGSQMASSQPVRTLDAYPAERSCPFSPPDDFERLRAEQALPTVPVLRGQRPWLVTRYEDAKAVLASPNFSARMDRPGFPLMSATDVQQLRAERPTLIRTDDPEHLQKRRRLTRDFTVKRINALEPEIQRIIDETIDDLLRVGGPADLVSELALPVPSRVICLLLGVPYEQHEFFQRKSAQALAGRSGVDDVAAALGELGEYLGELADAKRRAPQQDLFSRLVQELHVPGIVDRGELIDTAMTLLIAGFETTSNMIGLGVAALLCHPDQLEVFLAGDRALQENAVEELLRYLSIAQHPRQFVAVADTQVGNTLIRAGEGVLISLPSANRDPAAFADADVLDLRRPARHHLAFSYGTHQCLGQALARRELLLTYRTLFTRVPSLRLVDPVEEFDLKSHTRVHGFNSLNVTW